jgi:hypothetical protein
VYGWIWRHLPFGRPGKAVGSVLLALAAVALLWYVVFPAVDPHLPFNNDGQVTEQQSPPAGTGSGAASPGGTLPDDSQPDQDSVVPATPSAAN